MSWQRGRARVDELLASGELEHVMPAPNLADRLVEEARRHLASAQAIAASDPTGAYQLAYDCARKACAALLAAQGLRATTRGGHIAVQDTVIAQFGGKGGIAAFGALPRLRRSRAASEYPNADSPTVTEEDANDAITSASDILAAVRRIFDAGRLEPMR
ncbi:MAG: HEPN domain-containing protein [Acidimicrobiales bacterium]